MDLSTLISVTGRLQLSAEESKIPWDEPAFSQRMLENHLSQEHDWASRRQTVIEQQVTWIASQLSMTPLPLNARDHTRVVYHRFPQRSWEICSGPG